MWCVFAVSGAWPKVPPNEFEDLLGQANFTSVMFLYRVFIWCVFAVSGARPKVPPNEFEDLLGQANFTASSKKEEHKTIADMRRKQLEEDMDPDKLKVRTPSPLPNKFPLVI